MARRIAQAPDGRDASPQAGSVEVSTRKDSAPAPSHYVTADRLYRIARDMGELDWSVLNFVSASRLATGKQLIRCFWTDDPQRQPARARAGSRALKRLAGWRLLDALPGRARGGVRGGSGTLVYSVGVAGTKLLAQRGLDQRRLGAPGGRFIGHTLACTGVVVGLHVAHARGELDLIEVQQEPACHRAFLGAWGARETVKPDLFARVGVGALEDRWFVEVDLATEHAATLLAKAKRYISHYRSGSEQSQHGVYPKVLWVVPDGRRAVQIGDMLRRLPGETRRMFSVCLLDEVASWLAGEARA